MARPTLNNIESAQEAWDAVFNDNVASLRDGPSPIFQLPAADDEGDLAVDYPANEYDRCVAMVNHSTLGWIPMMSDGTNWVVLPRRAAAQGDSIAATLPQMVSDFNALLAKLRATGVMAP